MIPGETYKTNGSDTGDSLAGYFRTAKDVLFAPRDFYVSVKNSNRGFRFPLIFLVFCVIIHTFFVALTLRNATVITLSLLNALVMPFATAALLLLVLTRVFKASGTYEQSFMVVAYSAATALVSWIPLAGFVVECYRVYIMAIGLRYVFSVKMSHAVLAIAMVIVTYVIAFSLLGHFIGPRMGQGLV